MLIGDARLAHALADALKVLLPRQEWVPGSVYDVRPGCVVLSTTLDCPPGLCRSLADRDVHIVVLAAFPSETDRDAYVRSGASGYLPMDLDLTPLRELLESLVPQNPSAAMGAA